MLYDILTKLIAMNPHDSYLQLITVSLLTQRLHLKWQAIYMTETINSSRASFSTLVAIKGIIKTIEIELGDEDFRDNEFTGINAVKVVELYSNINTMNEHISECSLKIISFWKELLSDNLNGHKLELIGTSIDRIHFQVKTIFETVIREHPNHIYTLTCYGEYLTNIINELEEAEKITQKMRTIAGTNQNNTRVNNHFVRVSMDKNAFENSPCIVIASADYSSMGALKRINAECSKLLAWSEEDLIGKHIDNIMPKVFAENHDW